MKIININISQLRSLPLGIAYIWFSVLGLVFIFIGSSNQLLKELGFLLPIVACFLAIPFFFRLKKRDLLFLAAIYFIICLKFVVPVSLVDVQFLPYIMEFKAWIFLLFAFLYVKTFGPPKLETFKKLSLVVSVLYIMIFFYFLFKGESRRFGLGSESNYDGALILVGYIVSLQTYKFNREKLLFFLATLATQSRTGLICWFCLTAYHYRSYYKVQLLFIPLFVIGAIFVLTKVRPTAFLHMDRFIFWGQAIYFFADSSLVEFLFGQTPGIPLEFVRHFPGFDWYITNFEMLNSKRISGAHAFMFHSFWLRTAITMGVPFVLFILIYLAYKFSSKSSHPLFKYFCILLIVQGFSLALFHLTLVGIPLFLFFFSLLHEETRLNESSSG